MSHLHSLELTALREERQRLAQECERLRGLRRMVLARRDIEVAHLTGADLWGGGALAPAVRSSLEHPQGHGCPELLGQLVQSARTLGLAVDGAQRDLQLATDEMIRRYRRSPVSCLPPGLAAASPDSLL